MNISEVLSGHAGLAGVQWVLRAPAVRKILRGELRALLATSVRLGLCQLRRAKFKPGRKLTAYYDIWLHGSGGRNIRPIAVTWTPPGQSSPPSGLLEMQAEALGCGLAAPFGQLVAELSAWGMQLQVSPLDSHFPQLVRASEPGYVGDLLAETQMRAGGSRYTITPIRYRPGQRHVLRYDPVNTTRRPGNRGVAFAKLYPAEKGPRAFRVAADVAGWLAACQSEVTALRPQAYIATESLILYPEVGGIPLSRYMKQPGTETANYLEQVGTALRRLHTMPAALTCEMEQHNLPAEIKEIARASEHVQVLLPAIGAKINKLLQQAQKLYLELPQETPTFTYGDFKADHVWVTPKGLILIDFDTCRLDDPAYDLGKFLADLRWWFDTYHHPDLESAQKQFLAGYNQNTPPARLKRARLYEVLLLIKITMRRVRLFDADWAARTERLINGAEKAMRSLLRKRSTLSTEGNLA